MVRFEEKLGLLANIIKNNNLIIKNADFNKCKMSYKNISDLQKNGVIKREKQGVYKVNAPKLYFLATTLDIKEITEDYYFLTKCYEIEPNNEKICLSLFKICVLNKNYKEAFTYFDTLFYTENKELKNDINFYLYMLSLITDIPFRYQFYIKNINIMELMVDKNNGEYFDAYFENTMRQYVFKRSLNDITYNEAYAKKFHKFLIDAAVNKEEEIKETLITLIKNKDYLQVVTYLEQIEENNYLNDTFQNIHNLANYIIVMRKEGIISKLVLNNELIDNNALKTMIKDKSSVSSEFDKATINVLLDEIGMLIESIENGTFVKEEGEIIVYREEKDELELNYQDAFYDIFITLLNQNYNYGILVIESYLKNNGLENYETIIMELIKLDKLKEDRYYSNLNKGLKLIGRVNVDFNKIEGEFLKEFCFNLVNGNLQLARIYLNIISNLSCFGYMGVNPDGMYEVLAAEERKHADSLIRKP